MQVPLYVQQAKTADSQLMSLSSSEVKSQNAQGTIMKRIWRESDAGFFQCEIEGEGRTMHCSYKKAVKHSKY